jgi:hypothetical protein
VIEIPWHLLANRNGASENQMNPSPRFTTMRPESEDGSDSLSPVDFLYLKRFLYLALRKNGFNKAEAIPCDPKNQSTHRHVKNKVSCARVPSILAERICTSKSAMLCDRGTEMATSPDRQRNFTFRPRPRFVSGLLTTSRSFHRMGRRTHQSSMNRSQNNFATATTVYCPRTSFNPAVVVQR